MSSPPVPAAPTVYVVRHGTTDWSRSGRHTGLTDLPLTPEGEEDARAAGRFLADITFDSVWTSPLSRARRTCELAGQGAAALEWADLVEWDYGAYEGLTTAEIRRRDPAWTVWEKGGPEGESTAAMTGRVDRVLARLRAQGGTSAVFAHGHFLRALTVRWLGLDISWGAALALAPGAVGVLATERDRPILQTWNLRPSGS